MKYRHYENVANMHATSSKKQINNCDHIITSSDFGSRINVIQIPIINSGAGFLKYMNSRDE